MAYEPTNWVCGDVVTADKLNNLESGVQEALECCSGSSGGGMLIFTYTVEDLPSGSEECPDGGTKYTYSHSWQEIHDALALGETVVLIETDGNSVYQTPILSARDTGTAYLVDDITAMEFNFSNTTSKIFYSCSGR